MPIDIAGDGDCGVPSRSETALMCTPESSVAVAADRKGPRSTLKVVRMVESDSARTSSSLPSSARTSGSAPGAEGPALRRRRIQMADEDK
ncbi:hypothetical protein [Arthrobacter sp. FW306-04-A]|uniref:hypothetical protein n=1 Tax=Arthrobacter sp. FW306-04-A TaxID=2879619 RepID=UPI0037C07E86|nr:hypothetical protein LFT43_07375 [Arthrobacter sp. FW306-04-A]